jgi:IS4 transposase
METFMILNIIVLHTVNYVLFLCFFLLFFVWLFVSCPTFFLGFLGLVLLL